MNIGFGIDLIIKKRNNNIELNNGLARETLIATPLGSRYRLDYISMAEAEALDYEELRK